MAILACIPFGGALLTLAWGYERAPKFTLALGIGLVGLFGYGVLALTGRAKRPTSLVASVATAFCIFVGVWAAYIFQYCTCG